MSAARRAASLALALMVALSAVQLAVALERVRPVSQGGRLWTSDPELPALSQVGEARDGAKDRTAGAPLQTTESSSEGAGHACGRAAGSLSRPPGQEPAVTGHQVLRC